MTGERFHPIGPLAPGAPGRALRVFDRRTGTASPTATCTRATSCWPRAATWC